MELSTQVVLHVNVVYTHSSTSFAVTPLLIVKEARNIRTFIVVYRTQEDLMSSKLEYTVVGGINS